MQMWTLPNQDQNAVVDAEEGVNIDSHTKEQRLESDESVNFSSTAIKLVDFELGDDASTAIKSGKNVAYAFIETGDIKFHI